MSRTERAKAKRRRATCVLICLGAILVGCIQTRPTLEPVGISVAIPESQQEFYQTLVEAFSESYPHIFVELVPQGNYQLADADVYLFAPYVLNFIQDDLEIMDLTPFIEHDDELERADFYPGTLDLYRLEEETLGLPFAVDAIVMYYDRDLFDRYRVPYPSLEWTWEDFKRTGRALYHPEDGVYGYTPDHDLYDPLTFIYQHGGGIYDDFENPTRTTLDDPLNVEALDWYAGLMYKEEAAATPRQARQTFGIGGYVRFGIEQGRLGMWSGWISERGTWFGRSDWETNWGIAPLPRDARSATLGWVEGAVVDANAQNPDACWQWIVFLNKQIPEAGMPVRRSLVESEAYRDQVGEDVAAVAGMSADSALWFSLNLYEAFDGWRLYQQAAGAIVEGASPPQEALSKAQQTSQFR